MPGDMQGPVRPAGRSAATAAAEEEQEEKAEGEEGYGGWGYRFRLGSGRTARHADSRAE